MKIKRFRNSAMVLLTLLLLAGPAEAAGVNPHTSYVGRNWESSEILPAIKPLWTLTVDSQTPDDGRNDPSFAVTGGGKVYALQNGQLVAVHSGTGKKVWKAGAKLLAPLRYEQDRIYASSTGGTLYAFNALNGKVIWASSSKIKDAHQLDINGDQLYVAAGGNIQAYGLKDGKLRWTDDYEWPVSEKLLFAGDVVLTEGYESGAYSFTLLHAFDRKTGKGLWHNANYTLPIAVKDGQAIAQRSSNLLQLVPLTTLDTLDLKTGKTLKTVQYNPTNIDVSSVDGLSSGGEAWNSGGRIYINVGDVVYGYDEKADPSKVIRDSYKPQGVRSVWYAAGPQADRMIFTDGMFGIYGVKLTDKSTVYYTAGIAYPIARFDLIGHGIYVAQTNGSMVATNLITAKPVLRLETGGRVFGRTLLESGMIVVQTKGKLLAFKEPPSLHVK